MATALRNDVRICLLTGALAIVQFSLLSLFIMNQGDTAVASLDYGVVSASNQVQRVVVLLAVSMLTAVVVYRMQLLVQLSGTDEAGRSAQPALLEPPRPAFAATRQKPTMPPCRSPSSIWICSSASMTISAILSATRALRHMRQTLREQLHDEEPLIRIGGERIPARHAHADRQQPQERIEFLRKRLNDKPLHGRARQCAACSEFFGRHCLLAS